VNVRARSARNGTGDPALSVGGRPSLALRTPVSCLVVAAHRTRAISEQGGFQSGRGLVIPGACIPRASVKGSRRAAVISGAALPKGTARRTRASMTDETPTSHIGGPHGPGGVVSLIATLLSWRITERPGWQPRGLPDLSSETRAAGFVFTPFRHVCQWGETACMQSAITSTVRAPADLCRLAEDCSMCVVPCC
jgi:hypothetical protein